MTGLSPQDEIQGVLRELERSLESRDIDQVLELFDDTSYWRDMLAFTWNIITFENKQQIRKMLQERLPDVSPTSWELDHSPEPTRDDGITEGFFFFETDIGHGYGHIRVKNGRIFTLLTTMQDLKGFEEPGRYDNRPWGLVRGKALTDLTWGEERDKEFAELGVTQDPYVLIVGGGHNGIILAARLRLYGVPTLIIDTHERPGDNWRERYNNLQLHNPVWENHLPYIPFPEHWPVYMNKERFGDWLEAYTQMMSLNYWNSSLVKGAQYDEEKKVWDVQIERGGETITVHPTQLVMATGAEAEVSVPEIEGQDVFTGTQLHSSEYSRPDAYLDKKVVVVGSGTSAHDVASAFAARNGDVTMIQRSPTYVVRPESFNEYVLGPVYSAEAEDRGAHHGAVGPPRGVGSLRHLLRGAGRGREQDQRGRR
jgi:putative flavoprotein involved in K+ transport